MKVFIADDSRDIRGWLSKPLSAIADIEVVGAMGDLADAEVMLAQRRPDVEGLDLQLHRSDRGLTALRPCTTPVRRRWSSCCLSGLARPERRVVQKRRRSARPMASSGLAGRKPRVT